MRLHPPETVLYPPGAVSSGAGVASGSWGGMRGFWGCWGDGTEGVCAPPLSLTDGSLLSVPRIAAPGGEALKLEDPSPSLAGARLSVPRLSVPDGDAGVLTEEGGARSSGWSKSVLPPRLSSGSSVGYRGLSIRNPNLGLMKAVGCVADAASALHQDKTTFDNALLRSAPCG